MIDQGILIGEKAKLAALRTGADLADVLAVLAVFELATKNDGGDSSLQVDSKLLDRDFVGDFTNQFSILLEKKPARPNPGNLYLDDLAEIVAENPKLLEEEYKNRLLDYITSPEERGQVANYIEGFDPATARKHAHNREQLHNDIVVQRKYLSILVPYLIKSDDKKPVLPDAPAKLLTQWMHELEEAFQITPNDPKRGPGEKTVVLPGIKEVIVEFQTSLGKDRVVVRDGEVTPKVVRDFLDEWHDLVRKAYNDYQSKLKLENRNFISTNKGFLHSDEPAVTEVDLFQLTYLSNVVKNLMEFTLPKTAAGAGAGAAPSEATPDGGDNNNQPEPPKPTTPPPEEPTPDDKKSMFELLRELGRSYPQEVERMQQMLMPQFLAMRGINLTPEEFAKQFPDQYLELRKIMAREIEGAMRDLVGKLSPEDLKNDVGFRIKLLEKLVPNLHANPYVDAVLKSAIPTAGLVAGQDELQALSKVLDEANFTSALPAAAAQLGNVIRDDAQLRPLLQEIGLSPAGQDVFLLAIERMSGLGLTPAALRSITPDQLVQVMGIKGADRQLILDKFADVQLLFVEAVLQHGESLGDLARRIQLIRFANSDFLTEGDLKFLAQHDEAIDELKKNPALAALGLDDVRLHRAFIIANSLTGREIGELHKANHELAEPVKIIYEVQKDERSTRTNNFLSQFETIAERNAALEKLGIATDKEDEIAEQLELYLLTQAAQIAQDQQNQKAQAQQTAVAAATQQQQAAPQAPPNEPPKPGDKKSTRGPGKLPKAPGLSQLDKQLEKVPFGKFIKFIPPQWRVPIIAAGGVASVAIAGALSLLSRLPPFLLGGVTGFGGGVASTVFGAGAATSSAGTGVGAGTAAAAGVGGNVGRGAFAFGTPAATSGAVVAPLVFGAAVTGVFGVQLFNNTVLTSSFLPPADLTELQQVGEYSKYAKLSKISDVLAFPNDTPRTITYTITLTPEAGYQITVTQATDEISAIGGDLPKDVPASTDRLSCFPPATDPSGVITCKYSVPNVSGKDIYLNNTIRLVFTAKAKDGSESLGEKLSATHNVRIGNPQAGCFEYVDGPNTYSIELTRMVNGKATPVQFTYTSAPWSAEDKARIETAFMKRAGRNQGYYDSLCKNKPPIKMAYIPDDKGTGLGGFKWNYGKEGGGAEEVLGLFPRVIKSPTTLEYVLVHETGHAIHFRNSPLVNKYLQQFFKTTEPRCFTYPYRAACSGSEQFAEAIALYVVAKDKPFGSTNPIFADPAYKEYFDPKTHTFLFEEKFSTQYNWLKENFFGGKDI